MVLFAFTACATDQSGIYNVLGLWGEKGEGKNDDTVAIQKPLMPVQRTGGDQMVLQLDHFTGRAARLEVPAKVIEQSATGLYGCHTARQNCTGRLGLTALVIFSVPPESVLVAMEFQLARSVEL
jgi:hypothetical protein